MDINGLLDWLPVLLACGSTIGAAARGRASWAVVAGAIVAGGLATLVFAPDHAAAITFGVWFVLIAIPILVGRFLTVAAAKQNFRQARWLSLAIALLHPSSEFAGQARLFRGLALMQQGRWDLAEPKLRAVAGDPRYPVSQLSALSYLCRWSGDWTRLVEAPAAPAADPVRTSLRIRALGECGRLAEMLTLFEEGQHRYHDLPLWRPALLSVLAFGGRPDAVAAYCRTMLVRLPEQMVALWVAMARMAAGGAEAAAGTLEMERLAGSAAPDISRSAERRLASPPADASRMPDEWQTALRQAESEFVGPRAGSRRGRRWVPATAALVALNLLAFVIEGAEGGSQNISTLYRLGGVWPPVMIQGGQWWRLVAAMFLHAGPLHLAINLIALIFLGGLAEPMFGWKRFLTMYAVTGVGSMAGVVGLTRFGWADPNKILVGASGALMGIAGVLFAVLVTRVLTARSAILGRWVAATVLLIMLQSVIDLTTPQISFTGHAVGLSLGVLLGFLPWIWRSSVLPASLRAMGPDVGVSRRDIAIFGFTAGMIGAAIWVRMLRWPTSPGHR